MNEVEDFIERYKRELVAEAELARDDLQEIEDHLRTLTTELRESGMSSADAVRAACERLGDPRAVAREHAKVRSPFGARFSWARTISAAVLLMTIAIHNYVFMWRNWDRLSVPFLFLGATILSTVLIAALLARLAWARPIVLGAIGFMAMFGIVTGVFINCESAWMIPLVGTVVFVMPWRGSELYRAGYALVLHAFGFGAMAFAAGMLGADAEALVHAREHVSELTGMPIHMAPAALFGLFPALIAIAGTIMRARWAALASAFAAATLFVSVVEIVRYYVGFHELEYTGEWLPFASMLFASSLAESIAAVVSWRSARSNAGTLQYVLR